MIKVSEKRRTKQEVVKIVEEESASNKDLKRKLPFVLIKGVPKQSDDGHVAASNVHPDSIFSPKKWNE